MFVLQRKLDSFWLVQARTLQFVFAEVRRYLQGIDVERHWVERKDALFVEK